MTDLNTKTAKPTWTANLFNRLLLHGFPLLALAVVISLSGSVFAADSSEPLTLKALKPYFVKYQVLHEGDDVGTASRQLTQLSNGQWQIAMESDISYYFLSDKRQETSRFAVADGQILPLVYQRNSETSLRSDRTLLQNFDWDNKVEHGSYKDDEWTQPLRVGYLDQLSQVLVVREYLLTQKPIPAIDISYRGSIRHHQFKALGEESLKTKNGVIKTAKVQLNEAKRDRQTNYWFALEHDMLPVQVQRIKEGEEQAKLLATDW